MIDYSTRKVIKALEFISFSMTLETANRETVIYVLNTGE
jgi:hypothetical protein